MGDGRIEVYDRARFFTVTGNYWGGQLFEIEEHQVDLVARALATRSEKSSLQAWLG